MKHSHLRLDGDGVSHDESKQMAEMPTTNVHEYATLICGMF
jgi:hypothetical protein